MAGGALASEDGAHCWKKPIDRRFAAGSDPRFCEAARGSYRSAAVLALSLMSLPHLVHPSSTTMIADEQLLDFNDDDMWRDWSAELRAVDCKNSCRYAGRHESRPRL